MGLENLYDSAAAIAMLVATFAALGGGTWFSTEIVKLLAQGVGNVLPGALSGTKLSGQATWVVAAFVAVGYVLGLDIEVLGNFAMFEGLDTPALQAINAALLTIGANMWHDKVFDPK